ncbi:MAG: hypothetical protein JHC21_01305 [Thermocrinis sp.]|nr:hypothetical protein [Thermocrinis sp.]MCI4458240.1 hypothetical protein [Thermocrinis sp.]
MIELEDLMPQLARKLTKDFDYYHRSFYFLDVLGDYATILNYIWDMLFCPDPEPATKAVEVVKAFLNDEGKGSEWLRNRLREIWQEYEAKKEEQNATTQELTKEEEAEELPDDELPF